MEPWLIVVLSILAFLFLDIHLRFRAMNRKAVELVDEEKANVTAKLCAAQLAIRYTIECRHHTGVTPTQEEVDKYRADMYELCRWVISSYIRAIVFKVTDKSPDPEGGQSWETTPEAA